MSHVYSKIKMKSVMKRELLLSWERQSLHLRNWFKRHRKIGNCHNHVIGYVCHFYHHDLSEQPRQSEADSM